MGSGNNLLEGGWTLFHSGVVPCERNWAGVGLTYCPLGWCLCVGQEVDDRVASPCLRVKEQALAIVFACVLNGSLEYLNFLGYFITLGTVRPGRS